MTEKSKITRKPVVRDSSMAEDVGKKLVSIVRLHLWLETRDGLIFGPGRALLLSKIEEHGSLRKAAEELGMSYRAAWGKIKKTEKVLGMELIHHGSKKEGNRLTEEGILLNRRYLLWLRDVEEEALRKAQEIFPWLVRSYQQKNKPLGDSPEEFAPTRPGKQVNARGLKGSESDADTQT